ncbi:hypothetical protein DYB36_000094 [Aphanomyces astaci]|uniref:Sec1 family domain-containing protein 1 n=2 Tax=Aphanomyces astaci TaxID=112090 RepID=A0A397AV85_APHAT|nr:hypothetical protein DYB36_000094 [Aphanomyces astaci]
MIEFVRVLLASTNEIARGQAKNDLVRMMPGHVLQALEAFPRLHAKMPCLEDSQVVDPFSIEVLISSYHLYVQSKKAGASKKRKSRAKAHNADDDADLKAEQAALFKRAAAESQHRHIVVPKIIPSTEYRDDDRWGEQWKVLVYDHYCRDIISPILKLHELRKKGVTLHMLLENDREEIPDVPAIYFVQPTTANLERIIQDSTKELYSAMHLNFATPIPRDKLETFAKGCVDAGCTAMHANFVSLEPQLFSLNQPGSYVACNDAQSSDATIDATMSSIAQGLFSVLATLGTVPVIRCPPTDGPSRLVAERLTQTLRDHLTKRSGLFNDAASSFQSIDGLWQALVDDMLGIKLNRVAFRVPNDKGVVVDKSHDLDVQADKFFSATAGLLFPDAIASHEEELKVVLKKEKDISTKAGGGGNSTKELAAAVDTLPALLEMKKTLEVHTNVFQATMDAVTTRQVPEFSMLEQRLIEGFNVPAAEVVALLSEKVSLLSSYHFLCGFSSCRFTQYLDFCADSPNLSIVCLTLCQKASSVTLISVRLLMIYYLTTGASSREIAEFEAILRPPGSSTTGPLAAFDSAWKFIKQHTSLQKHASVGSSFSDSAPNNNATAASKLKGLANNWAGSFAGQAQGWLTQAAEQFKNFLPENKKLQVTRVADAISELRPNTEDESYLYLDPKIKAGGGGQVPRQRTPFRDVIVFVIGGGNYNEYQNLQAYAKAQPATHPRHVLYGCTELLTPNEFLAQLNQVHT